MKWISVKDKKPPFEENLIVCMKAVKSDEGKHIMRVGISVAMLIKNAYKNNEEFWIPLDPLLCEYDIAVSHWMEFPDYPRDNIDFSN